MRLNDTMPLIAFSVLSPLCAWPSTVAQYKERLKGKFISYLVEHDFKGEIKWKQTEVICSLSALEADV